MEPDEDDVDYGSSEIPLLGDGEHFAFPPQNPRVILDPGIGHAKVIWELRNSDELYRDGKFVLSLTDVTYVRLLTAQTLLYTADGPKANLLNRYETGEGPGPYQAFFMQLMTRIATVRPYVQVHTAGGKGFTITLFVMALLTLTMVAAIFLTGQQLREGGPVVFAAMAVGAVYSAWRYRPWNHSRWYIPITKYLEHHIDQQEIWDQPPDAA